MALFEHESPVLKDIKKLDPNSLSPIEALNKIYQWKKDLDKG